MNTNATPSTNRGHHTVPSIVSDDDTTVFIESSDDSAMSETMTTAPGHVAFSDVDQIYEIPARSTYSEEERRTIWYRKDDYQVMKQLAMETIGLDRTCGIPGGSSSSWFSMRGLECRTREGFARCKQSRYLSVGSVIDEQDRQDELGISDPDLIARVYAEQCVYSQYVAFAQGLIDAEALSQTAESHQDGADSSSSALGLLDKETGSSDQSLLVLAQIGMGGLHEKEEDQARREAGFQMLVQDLDETSIPDEMEWSFAEAA